MAQMKSINHQNSIRKTEKQKHFSHYRCHSFLPLKGNRNNMPLEQKRKPLLLLSKQCISTNPKEILARHSRSYFFSNSPVRCLFTNVVFPASLQTLSMRKRENNSQENNVSLKSVYLTRIQKHGSEQKSFRSTDNKRNKNNMFPTRSDCKYNCIQRFEIKDKFKGN